MSDEQDDARAHDRSVRALGPLIGAVDLGGTKADVALADNSGNLIARTRIPTQAEQGAETVLARVLGAVGELAAGRTLAALAVAVPASVDDGRVSAGTNVPGLTGFDVAGAVEHRFPSIPVHVVNDLNAAALAVADRLGDDVRGCSLVVGLGTGIAAATVVNGEIVHGSHGEAGEIGMTRIPVDLGGFDGFGGFGGEPARLEEVVGGRALDKLARELGLAGAKALLDASDTASVAAAVRVRLHTLAFAIATCVNLIDPHDVVFYGGLTHHPVVRTVVGDAIPLSGSGPRHVVWADIDSPLVLHGAIAHAGRALNGVHLR